MKKRLFFLSAFMLLTSLGYAQLSGSGTKTDPYQVRTADDLFDIRTNLSAHYVLMNDIDLTEWIAEEFPTQGWLPIPNFSGTFDGNNHSISGLFIYRPSSSNVGLFGQVTGAISNLKLVNPRVTGGSSTGALIGTGTGFSCDGITVLNATVKGMDYTGGIVGNNAEGSGATLSNMKVIGANITGINYVGGCLGYGYKVNQSYIKDIVVKGTAYLGGLAGYIGLASDNIVMGVSITGTEKIGGLVGHLWYGSINDCFVFDCKLSGTNCIGGIAGITNSPYVNFHYINSCYASGVIECSGDYCAGIVAYIFHHSTGNTGRLGINNCRFDGYITGTANIAAGVAAYSAYGGDKAPGANNNIVSGSIYGSNSVYGIYSGRGSNNVCCADTVYSKGGTAYRTGGSSSYAYNGMVVYSNDKKVEVADGGANGTGYSLRLLKKRNTYIGLGYDFDSVWAIDEDSSFPYLMTQSAPPTITSCISGNNGKITGTAPEDGIVYVFVNKKMFESQIISGQWDVSLGEVADGTVVNVYAEATGKRPSCKVSCIAMPGMQMTELKENETTLPEAATDVNVLLKRTIKADEWSTICLPFTATGEQVKQAWGEDVQLASFTGWESEEDGTGAIVAINVMFSSANPADGIPANTPMLIKVSKAAETATFDGVTIEPEEEPMVQVGKKASERGRFYGTYKKTIVPEENMFLSGNKFWYSTGKTTIKGYRGYFEFRDVLDAYYDGSEVKVYMFIDEDATGISKSFPSGENLGEAYNLAGQRVAGNYKGIVIENGKKILK